MKLILFKRNYILLLIGFSHDPPHVPPLATGLAELYSSEYRVLQIARFSKSGIVCLIIPKDSSLFKDEVIKVWLEEMVFTSIRKAYSMTATSNAAFRAMGSFATEATSTVFKDSIIEAFSKYCFF